MSVYEQSFRVLSTHVDARRRIRLSTLFMIFQEAAIAHTEALGMGRDKTLDKGLLWAVTMQRAEVTRLPEYDEKVRLASWPGQTMHVLFPRFYALFDADGEPLVRASALWVLLDQNTRKMVSPESKGIRIDGVPAGMEIPLPAAVKLKALTGGERFVVPYSAVDLNGHMNNARYFDLAEDRMPPALRALPLCEVSAAYSAEAKPGDVLTLREQVEPQGYGLCGEAGGKSVFRLLLRMNENIER